MFNPMGDEFGLTPVVPAVIAKPGDRVFSRNRIARVLSVMLYGPDTHPDSPIHNKQIARETRTRIGSRWHAHSVIGAYLGAEIIDQYPDGIRFDVFDSPAVLLPLVIVAIFSTAILKGWRSYITQYPRQVTVVAARANLATVDRDFYFQWNANRTGIGQWSVAENGLVQMPGDREAYPCDNISTVIESIINNPV